MSWVVARCVTTETGSYAAWQHRQPAEARTYPAVCLSMSARAGDVTGFGAGTIMSRRRAHRVELPDGNPCALDEGDLVEFGRTCWLYTGVVVMMNRQGDLWVSRVRALGHAVTG